MTEQADRQPMLHLARAALAHLEFEPDCDIWQTGTCSRPFGNSFSQSARDILFHARVLEEPQYGGGSFEEELTRKQLDHAERLWANLGAFIRDECILALKEKS